MCYHICVQVEGGCLQNKCCKEDWSQAVVEVLSPVVSLSLVIPGQHSLLQQLVSFSNFMN